MFRRISIPAFLALIALFGASVSLGEVGQVGTLRVTFGGGFSPHALPRHRLAPVTVSIEGSIATTDGSHPPALRRLEVALNRHGRLSARGLPSCTAPLLQSTTTQSALARCRPALVGRGRFRADVDLSGQAQVPATGTILVFNGRQKGKPALLLHLYGTVPVRATFVLPLAIERRSSGEFGTVLSAKVPTLAGGQGSITSIEMTIGREYNYRGQRRSYIAASCSAPDGFPEAVFSFARGSFYFADHEQFHTTLTRDCRVR
jgi:hypothetical protein